MEKQDYIAAFLLGGFFSLLFSGTVAVFHTGYGLLLGIFTVFFTAYLITHSDHIQSQA